MIKSYNAELEAAPPIKEFSHLAELDTAVSVIVPLYNEEEILVSLVTTFIETFQRYPFGIEFLLCENGSRDQTRAIAARLAEDHANVRLISIDEPSYGGALRSGIELAHGDLVVIFNADLWCVSFFQEALALLESGADIVIGSKRLVAANDHRPLTRRLITASFNRFLNVVFGFRGSDTHGMKALRRSRTREIIERCRTSKEVFDTEIVLRAQRAGLRICEIPTEVFDMRPARLSLIQRIPSTLKDLWTIWKTL